jgi:hypothetical protein
LVPQNKIGIIGHGEACARKIERYLVHGFDVPGFSFNNRGGLLPDSSVKSNSNPLIRVNAGVVQSGPGQVAKVLLRFVRYWSEVSFFTLQFHSWKLSTNVREWSFILVLE